MSHKLHVLRTHVFESYFRAPKFRNYLTAIPDLHHTPTDTIKVKKYSATEIEIDGRIAQNPEFLTPWPIQNQQLQVGAPQYLRQ